MRNRPQHGPSGAFQGPRRHRPAQGRGPGPGRRHNSPPEGRWQGPPSRPRGPQRHQSLGARGNWGHRPPRGRGGHHRPPEFDRAVAFRKEKTRRGKSNWRPFVDFSEAEDRFEVSVELPGVSQNDVNVSVTESQLTIKGKKKQEQTDETQNLRRSERRYGSFHRKFPLPPNIVVDGIKAEFKDGVLTVIAPKTEAAKPTEIPINADA
ncbi:MAG: Hsp20/alpha crystallin family protein [Candidatus Poribacteria bacterium]|nr:Hsp20/alpha crystallin family protein [Candidatus Poribacteria bacterium]